MKNILFALLTSTLLISCNDKSSKNMVDKDLIDKSIVNSKLMLKQLKSHTTDLIPLDYAKGVKKQVSKLYEQLDSIHDYDKNQLIKLNDDFIEIVEQSALWDSLKTETNKLITIDANKNKEEILSDVAFNSQVASHLLYKNLFDALFVFDLVELNIDVIEKEDGKYAAFSLLSAKERIRPNIYFGNRDTIQFTDWYRYKMAKYEGNDYIEEMKIPENMTDSIFGVYQVSTPGGHVTIGFSEPLEKTN